MKTCICCIIKNTPDYLLKEFINYHFELGIDQIYCLVDIGSNPVYEDERVTYLQVCDIPFQDYTQYTNTKKDCVKQLSIYNWFFFTYKDQYDFILYLDDDEFLHFDLKYLNLFTDEECIIIPWHLQVSNKLFSDERLDNFHQFRFSSNSEYSANTFKGCVVKSIVNTKKCPYIKNVHYASENGKFTCPIQDQILNKTYYEKIDDSALYINHYYIRSFEEWVSRVYDRGDLFQRITQFNYLIPNRGLIDYYILFNKPFITIDEVVSDLTAINRLDIVELIRQDVMKYAWNIVLTKSFLQTCDINNLNNKYGKDIVNSYLEKMLIN